MSRRSPQILLTDLVEAAQHALDKYGPPPA